MADEADSSVKEYSGKWWSLEISQAEKTLDEKWRTRADKVVSRYLDDRDDDQSGQSTTSRYNIFWANVAILKSALYANPPKPVVTRQHGDAKDDIGRTAALMLQRLLTFGITQDQSPMHNSLKAVVEDRLIPGLGQVWLRYVPKVREVEIPAVPATPTTPEQPASMGKEVVGESVECDYVYWRDFIWSPCRTWEEVWWVARRVWMKRAAFIKRFGKDKYEHVKSLAEARTGANVLEPKGFRKGRVEVYEVWCEDTNSVYFVHPALDDVLEVRSDPLGLRDFFPCPPPLLATHTTNSVIPRPDFVMVQDQYNELDDLNHRINVLTRALRVVGVYDKTNAELGQLLRGGEFNMIAVENWAAFAEKQGLKGSVDWFPVEQIAAVLEKLMIQRQSVIQQIYELTSISDIMRGVSQSRETAKAQTLKAQYSSVRLQLTQGEVATFVKNVLRIKAEIVCNKFQPKNIIEQSRIMDTESAVHAEQAVALLKDYEAAEYRIEVNEESLSLADYNAERELRMELATALGQLLSQSAGMVELMPASLPYILRIIQWVISSFRGSSDIETVLDEAVKMAEQTPPPSKPEKPDHSLEIAQLNAQKDIAIAEKNNASREKVEMAKLTQAANEKMADTFNSRAEAENEKMEKQREREIEIEREAQEAEMNRQAVQDIVKVLQEALGPLVQAGQVQAEAASQQLQAAQMQAASVQELAKALVKPRRRIPKYDDRTGDLLYADDVIVDEEQPQGALQ